ncbi:hypothetical protein Cgig2_030917 [Carnegiea gigantea]|uniref:Neprosin activation peptide domain-containing protein n=1 Tax=Carnegiea gigantea TaxID=171969 RepID=A0A9Q1QL49_9CARY|nr:hypothetical protein Cgig2_030917 [Carnegiea gigantea]
MTSLGNCCVELYVVFMFMQLLAIALQQANPVLGGTYYEISAETHSVPLKGTVKSIKFEDEDIVDCVDIYQQPAFKHPLLRNHTVQMDPSSRPSGWKAVGSSHTKLIQLWSQDQVCPNGIVPIRRTTMSTNFSSIHSAHFRQPNVNSDHQVNHCVR